MLPSTNSPISAQTCPLRPSGPDCPEPMHVTDVWPDAKRFDIGREPSPNLSFGRGRTSACEPT
jgi:hypothetical protein